MYWLNLQELVFIPTLKESKNGEIYDQIHAKVLLKLNIEPRLTS